MKDLVSSINESNRKTLNDYNEPVGEIYQVVAEAHDLPDGKYTHREVLKRFFKKIDAEEYKKIWEAQWNDNYKHKRCVSPCWYDYPKQKLKIETIKIY